MTQESSQVHSNVKGSNTGLKEAQQKPIANKDRDDGKK
jgi:hypothetical protein